MRCWNYQDPKEFMECPARCRAFRRYQEVNPLVSGGPLASAEASTHRDPLWARLLIVFGAVLMLVSGGLLVSGRALLRQYVGAVHRADILGRSGTIGSVKIDGPLNIL